jgi:RNA polymerase sigma-70 factor (ECF subfamily)
VRESGDFDAFYASTSRRVLGHMFAMTGRIGEAEDAVQEAYARAWQRWATVSQYGDPEAWVRTVAYRISVSTWRKANNRFVAHRRHGPLDDPPGLSPDHVALAAALRLIPAEQRQVIVLHYLVGQSVEQVAAETGVPVNTVKSRLARGRRALANHVSEFVDEPTDRRVPEVRNHA